MSKIKSQTVKTPLLNKKHNKYISDSFESLKSDPWDNDYNYHQKKWIKLSRKMTENDDYDEMFKLLENAVFEKTLNDVKKMKKKK